jgi:hypothetical protein
MIPLPALKPPAHRWKFFRAGGFDQVSLSSGADLLALDQLDLKLWFALACPTRGLEFDSRTLELIDTDGDGRVRAPEITAAARWIGSLLKNPDDLLQRSEQVRLDAIRDSSPEGSDILASARQILRNLGKPEATTITLADTSDTARIFAQTRFNGDGIIPVEAAENDSVRAVLQDIIACLGSETDRSGLPGINQPMLDRFFIAAQAWLDWHQKADADDRILPLGKHTAAASSLLLSLRPKIDDYFARCRLAAFDARATDPLNRDSNAFMEMATHELTLHAAEIACLPLAKIAPDKPLPLKETTNPAWAHQLLQFHETVVQPLLGDRPSLSESDWAILQARFRPYQDWLAEKSGASVEPLGPMRIREILKGNTRKEIEELIARDKALEPEAKQIATVDRLVRYHAYIVQLLNNFVAFRDFYGGREMAIFQAGTLYLDQRACDLCLPVDDAAKHAGMAALAGTYLAYCDCTRQITGEKRQIVAAFTNGDADHLMVGRNGIFYDRQGRDWDATITKIVENPISLRQAFWAPYKKLVRLIEEQIAKRAAAADSTSTTRLESIATTATAPDRAAPATPGRKFDVGVIAAMGVALGAIGTFMAAVFSEFLELRLWQIALVLVGFVLLISLPSVIMAWLKLRKRSLGPILDANGWAINSRANLSVPFGKALTHVARLPSGAQRNLSDPYAETHSGRKRLGILLVLVLAGWCLWYFGALRTVAPWLPVSSYVEQQAVSKDHTTPDPAPLAPAPATGPAPVANGTTSESPAP